jgi:hypothetical protein
MRTSAVVSGVALVVLCFGLGACTASLSKEARRAFSEKVLCPLDQVSVSETHGRTFAPRPPNADVVANAKRLAMWQDRNALIAERLAERTYYVANGCSQERTYWCDHADLDAHCTATSPEVPDGDILLEQVSSP